VNTALLTWLPVILIALSAVAAVAIFLLPERSVRSRSTINLAAAAVKVAIIIMLVPLILEDEIAPEFRASFLPGIDLVLSIDSLSLLFAALSAILWLLTTVYAIGYLKGTPNLSRFFGFFSLCVTATVGIAFAGNLVTFLLFYEMLSLVTYPLVAHFGTPAALKAARLYLFYALSGGLVLLVGIVWLTALVGPVEFRAGGVPEVAALAVDQPATATVIFVLLAIGLGVKSALFPLHSWLPRAMVAPAPVSALLHAVAVVKAGVFGLTRLIDDLYGVPVAASLGVLAPLLVVAAVTIIYGSLRALAQVDIKKRLAYSTVSQVSYIVLGLSMVSVAATTGGIVHLVHQGLAKITLFFCAGLVAEVLGITKISELAGLGRRMPLTALAFTVAAMSMIGLPPLAGFITKWQLGLGAVDAGSTWVLAILATSTLLNAAYFLPLVLAMWFRPPATTSDSGAPSTASHVGARGGTLEAPPSLLWPTVVTASLTVVAGLTARLPYSPLSLATDIAERVFP
jgi:multicomponent Na+:H+ antiporter subunit D